MPEDTDEKVSISKISAQIDDLLETMEDMIVEAEIQLATDEINEQMEAENGSEELEDQIARKGYSEKPPPTVL